ncbi:MAG TPA: sialate O-acetylesterase [Bryobacteraceae bacterium]|nr:sialate O-acetylesterase [Bryobacteraceae bacterium]
MFLVPTALVFSLLPRLAFAQSFAITSGPATDQVLQRDEAGKAVVNLSGTALSLNNKPLEIRAIGINGVLPSDWAPAGKIAADKWSAKITLPTGGPYRVEVRSNNIVQSVTNLLVGDLWVLGGQSNMEGVGNLIDVEPPHGLVHSFDQSDQWGLAQEPLHNLPGAADRVHWRKNKEGIALRLEGTALAEFIANRKKGAGLGLAFAAEMVRRTGVPIGLLPCAHGGTSMDQWSPDLRDKAGDSLYGATIRRVKLAGGKVRGMLWYQGESDANPNAASGFQAKFERLVAAFRSDLGDPGMRFYYVQVGRYVNSQNQLEWNEVQEMQRKAEKTIPQSGMVASVDLSLDDAIHIGTRDQKRLGRRLANLAAIDLFGTTVPGVRRGPRPVSAKLDGSTLRVTFSDVNGRLTSQGRISGFSIHDSAGAPIPAIFQATFDHVNHAMVVLHLGAKIPDGATLRYGFGKDPYCNVRDQADMAAPVFGPMVIER